MATRAKTAASPALAPEADELDQMERALIDVMRRFVGRDKLFIAVGGTRIDRAAYMLMMRLEECGGVRLSDLATTMELDLSTVSRQAKQLEDLGLITRRPDPADRRAARLELSEAGRQTLAAVRQQRQIRLGNVLLDWPAKDRARMTLLLRRLAEGLGPLDYVSAPPSSASTTETPAQESV